MDYSKTRNPKSFKDAGRQTDPGPKPGEAVKAKGGTRPKNARPGKDELLARMKAAAEAKKGG
jgi:hypothetical protein